MPERETQPAYVSPEVYRQQQVTRSQLEAAELRMDYAPEGGRYLVDGIWRDANGLPCDPPKGAKEAEKAFAQAEEERVYAARLATATAGYGPDANADAARTASEAARLQERQVQRAMERERLEREARKSATETVKANREGAAEQADAERAAIAEQKAKQAR